MRRMVVIAVLAMSGVVPSIASAGSPHFVGAPTYRCSGTGLHVDAKEAGLGGESINVTVAGLAQCYNPGGQFPAADNKQNTSESFPVTVHNGKATISKTLSADISPNCSGPMKIVWSNVTVTDNTNNVSVQVIEPDEFYVCSGDYFLTPP